MNSRRILSYIGSPVVNALFPPRCISCDVLFLLSEYPEAGMDYRSLTFETVMKPFLCPDCITGFQTADNPVYGAQFRPPRRFRAAFSSGIYAREQTFGSLIRLFKYSGEIQLADPLGMLLFRTFVTHCRPEHTDMILPVPLHVKRFRERGFNQAWMLIRKWPDFARKSGVDTSGIEMVRNGLERIRKTRPQAGLGHKARAANIEGAFGIRKGFCVKGRKILLVDDVLTTGATADECTKALLRNGAASVNLLTLARARNPVPDEDELKDF